MNYKHKHLLLIIACVIFAITLPFFITIDWWACVIIPIGFILTKGIGSEIGAHRLWSHRSFSTKRIFEKIIIILNTLAGEGSIIAFAGIHRLHHKYSDTDQDPHSPKFVNWWAIILYQHNTKNFNSRIIKDLLHDPWLKWQHKNYFNVQLVLIMILLFASPLALWYYAVNILMTVWIDFLVNIVCHRWGPHDNNTIDSSTNNLWTSIFLLGAHLHNNHHANAGGWNNAYGRYNFDLWALIIRTIRIKPVPLVNETNDY